MHTYKSLDDNSDNNNRSVQNGETDTDIYYFNGRSKGGGRQVNLPHRNGSIRQIQENYFLINVRCNFYCSNPVFDCQILMKFLFFLLDDLELITHSKMQYE